VYDPPGISPKSGIDKGEKMAILEKMALGKAVARAWSDAHFRSKLLADPKATLTEAGVHVPPHVNVHVVENSKNTVYVVLPPAPAQDEITPDSLKIVEHGARMSPILCINDGV
jgi:hypothetical protein